MNKRVTDSLDWLAGSVMNVSMNGQIVMELWPGTEVPGMMAISALEASTLCLPLHPVLSASQHKVFHRERKLIRRRTGGDTQKYAGLQSITARGKFRKVYRMGFISMASVCYDRMT